MFLENEDSWKSFVSSLKSYIQVETNPIAYPCIIVGSDDYESSSGRTYMLFHFMYLDTPCLLQMLKWIYQHDHTILQTLQERLCETPVEKKEDASNAL